MRRVVTRGVGLTLLLAAVIAGVAGCRSHAPMLQPVAPVPTITTDGSGGADGGSDGGDG